MSNTFQTTETYDGDLECREAVGVFPDKASLEAAIDDLLLQGFDRGEISLLASESAAERKLGLKRKTAEQLADDPNAHRTVYVSPESIGDAEGAMVSGCTYVPAISALWIASNVAGTAVAATVATAATGGVGLLVGSGLAYWLARRHSSHIKEQLENGGLLLWVRTPTPELEQKSLQILQAHAASHVHLHDASAL